MRDELRALGQAPAAAVAEAMGRYERDESLPREVKTVGRVKGRMINELRVSLGGNEYRVLFAKIPKQGEVVLALTAFSKKRAKLSKQDLENASKRLSDWISRGAV